MNNTYIKLCKLYDIKRNVINGKNDRMYGQVIQNKNGNYIFISEIKNEKRFYVRKSIETFIFLFLNNHNFSLFSCKL